MNRPIPSLIVLSTTLCAGACVQTRPAEFEPFASADAGTDGGEATSAAAETGQADDESGEPDTKLDLAAEPDGPSVECASITQTTDIVERPADIILIADRDIARDLIQDQVTNLLPGMESDGVVDANVVHLFDGGAPPPTSGDDFDCGEWACRGATAYGSVYAEFETSIPAGGVLEAVLSTEALWAPHMRADAWKHIWITTSASAESGISIGEFSDQLQAQLDAQGAEGSVFVHVFGAGGDVMADARGYTGLADVTGGHAVVADLDFFEFQNAVVDRVKGASLACQYAIPTPPDGLAFDRDKVNVIYDAGDGPLPVGAVESVADCQQFGAGWYYDDPADPTEIRMCPLSCETFQDLANATIDIEFGCATIPAG